MARPTKIRGLTDKEAVLTAAAMLAGAIQRGSVATADRLLAREFCFIDATGLVHSRRAVLARLRPAPRSANSLPTVRVYGRVAVLIGGAKSAQARQRDDLLAVDIWVRGSDGWKALIHHNNVLARPALAAAHLEPAARPPEAAPPDCRNPCEFVPYEPKSQAERDIIVAFQALEKAVTRNNADEWIKHVADEFAVYRTGQYPTSKSGRIAIIGAAKTVNAETVVAEVTAMKLWVFGDAAIMRADHVMPGDRRPPYRATRLWVKRSGRWLMAVSQQTTIAG